MLIPLKSNFLCNTNNNYGFPTKKVYNGDTMPIDINQPRKNITRFTYEFTSFQGWRVTLCRQQKHFTRYFSDKQYGGAEESLRAAIDVLERVKETLRIYPNDPMRAFALCHIIEPQTNYPVGVRPRKDTCAVFPARALSPSA